MTDSIGTARLDIVVDTSSMEAAIERAKSRTTSMSQSAQAEYAKLDRAEKRRVDRLIDTANKVGLTRQQQIAYDAALKTSGALQDDITRRLVATEAAARGTATQFSQNGKSVREMAFAMRGLPAQLTDIFTSLASGQRPMLVLLQQGGQLKDMFGGIGPAARALGGALRGLLSPTALLAGGAAVLATAWYKAETQQDAFDRALARTGNYLALTTDQLDGMADRLNSLEGVTKGSAVQAIAQIAETGKFTADQLETVSRAALEWERATGQAVDDTVAQFDKLRKDPVAAVLELNDTYHFLTQSQLDHIEQLEEEGRHQEAVTAAFEAYAGMIDSRAPRIEQSVGLIAGAWRGVKEAAAGAWDATVQGIQRADREAKEGLGSLSRFISGLAMLRSGPAGIFGFNASVATHQAPTPAAPATATVDTAAVRAQQEAAKEFDRLAESNLSRRAKLEREIADIRALGLKAGRSDLEIETQVAAARKRYIESLPKPKKSEEQKDAERLQKAYESLNQSLDREIALSGDATRAAAVHYDTYFGALSALDPKLKAVLEEQAKWRDFQEDMVALDGVWAQSAEEAANAHIKAANQASDKLSEFGREAARNMQDAFADFLFDPFKDGVKGMVESFAKAIQRMVAEVAASRVFDAIGTFASGKAAEGGGGFWSAVASAFSKNATGGVYASKSLSAYSGGVYNSPRLFAFANGAGVFGEAGPEAIMPLKRGRDGKLGVQSSGSGLHVEVNNYGAKVSAREETVPGIDGGTFKKLVIDVIADDTANGGKTARAQKARFGLREAT